MPDMEPHDVDRFWRMAQGAANGETVRLDSHGGIPTEDFSVADGRINAVKIVGRWFPIADVDVDISVPPGQPAVDGKRLVAVEGDGTLVYEVVPPRPSWWRRLLGRR